MTALSSLSKGEARCTPLRLIEFYELTLFSSLALALLSVLV